MTVITLLTDFGSTDGYPGVMKGVIWKIAPQVKIADLSHDISAQDILEAALLLGRQAPYFPDGTIHVAVVDPGVGTARRGIAARFGSQYFVGPDNGLLTVLLATAEAHQQPTSFIHLDRREYWLPEVSNVFHGRDIFAPVAAYLATGVDMHLLGTAINDPIRLEIPQPEAVSGGWRGQVIHIDHFGNLSTNLNANQVKASMDVMIEIKGQHIKGLVSTFGERPAGTLIAVLDSSGSLAISLVNGNAAHTLNSQIGDPIEIHVTG